MTKRPRGYVALADFTGRTLATAAREAAEDQGLIKRACPHCEKFFAAYRCSKRTHLECDCPKCQGYCECNNGR
jgi:hypothetical protein